MFAWLRCSDPVFGALLDSNNGWMMDLRHGCSSWHAIKFQFSFLPLHFPSLTENSGHSFTWLFKNVLSFVMSCITLSAKKKQCLCMSKMKSLFHPINIYWVSGIIWKCQTGFFFFFVRKKSIMQMCWLCYLDLTSSS